MIAIPITSHAFEKINSITIVKRGKVYDILQCSSCGLTGKRYGLEDVVYVGSDRVRCKARLEILDQNYERQERLKRASKVEIDVNPNTEWQFGIKVGVIYDIVNPPDGYEDKYPDSVWVYSEKRGEPVRLLPGEFILVGGEDEHSV